MGKLLAGSASDTGRVREHNEDMVRLADLEASAVARRGFLVAVADGMGGHERGEVASSLAVETLFASYYDEAALNDTPDDAVTALKRAFKAANERIIAESAGDQTAGAMGTTMVAATVEGAQLTVANVGDSRAYLVRAEAATPISRDHSLVAEQVASGLMTPEEARESNYRNVITRALGHRPKLDVDIFELGLLPDDRIVLCSDGVHGHVEAEEFADLTLRHDPQEASQALIELAMERGSTDNVSAVVVWFAPETAEPVGAPAGSEPVAAGGRGLSPVLLLLVLVLIIAAIAAAVYFFVWS